MSENNRRGKRKASESRWSRYRAWTASLDRGARLRYRILLALAVIAVLILGVALYLRAWISLPKVPDPPPRPVVNTPDGSGSQGTPGTVDYEGAELPDVMFSGRKEGYYTFLLAGRDTTSGLTDTMMLITFDTRGQKISAVSLLRDTMVNTSGKTGGQKRLNAVYVRNLGDKKLSDKERTANGMTALKQEVGKLTGIYPDFYVLVEWEAIGRLVDAIDGVYFDVPPGMDYDDPYQDLHIHQEAGYRLLNGQDAMEVIRFRKNNDESVVLYDAGRTQIQRDFLAATLKKCLTPEILLKVPSLARIFMENVSTDLTMGNILAFAQLAVGMDVDSCVNFASMPGDVVSYRGASLVVARQDELLELLNNGLNPYLDEIGPDDLQLMYRKRGGGFDVTNTSLLDPAVGQPPVKAPEPADPNSSQEPDEATAPPEGTDPPGGEDDPSEKGDTSIGGVDDIDPGDIFPDPSHDIQGGAVSEPEEGSGGLI